VVPTQYIVRAKKQNISTALKSQFSYRIDSTQSLYNTIIITINNKSDSQQF